MLKDSVLRLYSSTQAPIIKKLQAGEGVSLGETRLYQGEKWVEVYSGKQKIGYCLEPEEVIAEAKISTDEPNMLTEFWIKFVAFFICFLLRGHLLTHYHYSGQHWVVPLRGQLPWNLMEIAIYWVGLFGMLLILLTWARKIPIYAWILIAAGLFIWVTPGVRHVAILEDQRILEQHWWVKTQYRYSDVDKVEQKYELVRFSKHYSHDWVEYIRFKNGKELKILHRDCYYNYIMTRADENFYIPPPVRISGYSYGYGVVVQYTTDLDVPVNIIERWSPEEGRFKKLPLSKDYWLLWSYTDHNVIAGKTYYYRVGVQRRGRAVEYSKILAIKAK